MTQVMKTLKITSLRRKNSDLIVAFSDDLPGLMVSGRTEDEIVEKLPDAIREIFEAMGNTVLEVTASKEDDGFPEAFETPAFIADAALQEAGL